MQKIDIHIHAALHRQPRRPSPRNPEDCYLAEPPELLAHLESQGIGRALVMSSGTRDPETGNDACCRMTAAHPGRLGWMANIEADTPPEAVAGVLAGCKGRGAVGIGELAVNEWIDSPRLEAVFAAAETLGLPVTIHMSPEPGYQYGVCDRPGLPLLEQTLRRHPGLRLLGHSQLFWLEISGDCPRQGNDARSRMGRGPVTPGGRVPVLLAACPNLYADLSAFSASCAILRDEAFGLAFLETWQDRLLYGTDTLNRHQVFPLGRFLDRAVADGRLSRTAYEKICRENARQLFHL